MQEFITHWTAVNTDLGAGGPLVLTGSYAVGNLTSDRSALEAKMAAVEASSNTLQIAAQARDNLKGPMRERIRQFRALIQAFLRGSQYVNAPPKLPRFNGSLGEWYRAMDDMLNLWTQINASPPFGFTPPLKLQGNYLITAFATDVVAMKTAFVAWEAALQNAKISREQRNQLLPPIPPRLTQYRMAVLATYPPTHALVQSLPAIRPPSGSTPDPVQLSGTWNETEQKASLVWTASDDAALKEYSVRACDPPRYKSDEEQVVATVDKTETAVLTDFGLLAEGSVKYFKVYVVTNSLNEKGSNSVRVTHPE